MSNDRSNRDVAALDALIARTERRLFDHQAMLRHDLLGLRQRAHVVANLATGFCPRWPASRAAAEAFVATAGPYSARRARGTVRTPAIGKRRRVTVAGPAVVAVVIGALAACRHCVA